MTVSELLFQWINYYIEKDMQKAKTADNESVDENKK